MKQISDLPDDIIILIQEFMPHFYVLFVNKTFYNLYHHNITKYIPLYENYVRDVIRRDNEFVFERIISENIDLWLKKNKQLRYKNMVFNNYVYFILYLCIENNSDHCREIIHTNLKNRDLLKNLYKKNIIKYIKWKN